MESVVAALEEYKSLRQEKLDALGRVQGIAHYGVAIAGVGVGIGLVTSRTSVTLGAVVLMGIIPLTAMFGGTMLIIEAQRVARATWYLRGIEARINAACSDREALGWETRIHGSTHRVRGYIAVAVIVLLTAITISLGLGGTLLLHHEYIAGATVSGAADLFALSGFGLWSRAAWKRLTWYRDATPYTRPPWA